MSIIIKRGMKIPNSCWSCDMPLGALECPVQTEEEAMRYCSCRHKDCPLILVPPHGRLIDADRLKEVFHRNVESGEAFDQLIDIAPTIIPAEEGKT